jgi:hypothetical protein
MSRSDNTATAFFTIRDAAEPQAMPRLLELFAARSIVPERWRAERVGEELRLAIEIADMESLEAERLAERMRQMIHVHRVLTRERRLARAG